MMGQTDKGTGDITTDVAVIGGGPAGLAAATAAAHAGAKVTLIERDRILGGILPQCIHDGFGVHRFGEALTGPEYAQKCIALAQHPDITILSDTTVVSLSPDRRMELSSKNGFSVLKAKAVVLAMGCRERPAGAISIPGTRPAGVYTAGSVQNMINLQNRMPGTSAVILGSGDIGLIMARRLTLEGAKVNACYELQPYSSGLPRNVRQCLNDFDIPLHLSSTVIEIRGKEKLESVVCARMENGKPVAGTEHTVPCDMLLLSVGLIPENELSRMAGVDISPLTGGAVVDGSCMTSVPGIFSCGNVLHVHDLVDFVSEEADRAGHAAARYASGQYAASPVIGVSAGSGVRYVLPQNITADENVRISLRVKEPARNGYIVVKGDGREIARRKIVRLHPAEMQRVNVHAEHLAGINSLELSVL